MTISFTVTKHEAKTIRALTMRARTLELEHGGQPRPVQDWTMDFTACHTNGCALRLDALLKADDFNFMHDAFGICRHLNRETGELDGRFLPRFHQKGA